MVTLNTVAAPIQLVLISTETLASLSVRDILEIILVLKILLVPTLSLSLRPKLFVISFLLTWTN